VKRARSSVTSCTRTVVLRLPNLRKRLWCMIIPSTSPGLFSLRRYLCRPRGLGTLGILGVLGVLGRHL